MTVSVVGVAVLAGTKTFPEAPVNRTVLLLGVELNPEPFNVSVEPTAARVGEMDVNESGCVGGGGVNVIPAGIVPAATLAKMRRLRKKKSSIP